MSPSNQTQADHLSALIKSLNFYYPIVLSTLATVSNLVSLIVFLSRAFKSNPSGLVIMLKSLVDISDVYFGTLRFTFLASTGQDVLNFSRFSCLTLITLIYSIDAYSSWLNVFISLDRLFLIVRPSTYQSIGISTLRKYQLRAAIVFWFIILAINSSKLSVIKYLPVGINQTSYKCTAINQSLVDWINLTITLTVPFALMIVSSSTMIYYLAKKSSLNRSNSKKSKKTNFIKTVLSLDLCFLAFNLPRFATQLYRSSGNVYVLILQISAIIKYGLNTFTLVIWLITNSLFRSQFTLILSRGLSKRKRTQIKPSQTLNTKSIINKNIY